MVSKNRHENPHADELQEVLAGEPDVVGNTKVSNTPEHTLRFDEGSQHAEELAKALAADLDEVQTLAQEYQDENPQLSAHEALQKAITFVELGGFTGYNEAELEYIVRRAESYKGNSAPHQAQETTVAAVESEPATREAEFSDYKKQQELVQLRVAELTKLYEAILQYPAVQGRGFDLSFQSNVNELQQDAMRHGSTHDLDETIAREKSVLADLEANYSSNEQTSSAVEDTTSAIDNSNKVTPEMVDAIKNSIEANRLQSRASTEGQHEPKSAAVEAEAISNEQEIPLEKQWAEYVFGQRKFREINTLLDRKKEEYIDAGNTEEDFYKRKVWSAHKEALHELGIILDKDLDTFTVAFTKEVMKSARQMNEELRERKSELATALAENPGALDKLNNYISRFRKRNKEATFGEAAQDQVPRVLQVKASTYDDHLTAGDYAGIVTDARGIARERRLAISSAVDPQQQAQSARETLPNQRSSTRLDQGPNRPDDAEYAKQTEEAAQKIAPVLPEVMQALRDKKKALKKATGKRYIDEQWNNSTRYTVLRSEFVHLGALDADAVVSNKQLDDILEKSREIRRNTREAEQGVTEPAAPKSAEAPSGTSSAEQEADLDTKIVDIARQVAEYDQVLGPYITAGQGKHRAEYFKEHDNFDGWHASDALINTLEDLGLLTEQDLEGLDDRARRKLGGKIWSNIKQARKDYKENIAKIDEDAVKKWIETDAADKFAKIGPGAFNAIVNEKYEAFKADNPDAKAALFRFDIAKKEALKELGVINSYDAQSLTADHINTLIKSGIAAGRNVGELQPTGAKETGSSAPETNAQKIRTLEDSIVTLQQEFGRIDQTSQRARDIKTDLTEARAEIEAIKGAETPEQMRERLEEDKQYWQAEIDKLEQEFAAAGPQGLPSPKILEYKANIRAIEDELEALDQPVGAPDERATLELEKAALEDQVGQLEANNPYDPEILRLKGEIVAKQERIDALGQPGTAPDVRTQQQIQYETLKNEVADLQREYAALPADQRDTDQAKALQNKIIDKLNELQAVLQAEYDAFPDEIQFSLGANLTPEQQQAANRANDLRIELSLVEAARDRALRGEIVAPPTAEEQHRAQRDREIRAAREQRIRHEAFVKNERIYRAALNEYAQIRALNEAKEEGMFARIGRKKRQEELRIAREKLHKAKLQYEYDIVKAKHEAGLYEGDEAAVAAAQSDELFEGLASLDEQARTETLKIHQERAENRNGFQKAFIKIGKMLSVGNKFARVAKPAGAGAALGGIKALALATSGATLPVSIGFALVASGLTAGIKYGASKHNIDTARAEESADRNENGALKRRLTDEQVTQLKALMEGATIADLAQHGYKLANGVLEQSEKTSLDTLKKARGKAAQTMGFFALGAGVSGIAAHFAPHGYIDGALHHNASFPGDHDSASGAHPNEGSNSGRGYDSTGGKDSGPSGGSEKNPGTAELVYKGRSFFVDPSNGPIKEIQQTAAINGHKISLNDASKIYEKVYAEYGDKMVSGGPTYHGPNGDLRFGESGNYKWGKGALKDIVTQAAKVKG